MSFPIMPMMRKVKNGAFKYTNSVSALETITVPAPLVNDFVIDWGDGSPTEHITIINPSHEYASAGNYQISIVGEMQQFRFANGGNKLNIISLDNWGNVGLIDLNQGFFGCTNMLSIPGGPITGASLLNIGSTFRNTGITSIPGDLLDNLPNLTSVTQGFRDSPVTSIGNGLFHNNPLITNYQSVFLNVASGAVLPSSLFVLSNLNIVTSFDFAFNASGSGFTGTAQDIWNYATSATSLNTYLNQTNISNYASIPNNWKGL